MSKKQYKNVIRSKESIERAFLSLLVGGTPLEKISISTLCEKADVNRGTFYNHYKNIDDVLSSVENSFMDNLTVALQRTDLASREGRQLFFTSLGNFLEAHKKDALAISQYLPTRTFLDIKNKFNKTLYTSFPKMIGSIKTDDHILEEVRFFVSGMIGNYIDTITDGTKTIQEASIFAYELSNDLFDREVNNKRQGN